MKEVKVSLKPLPEIVTAVARVQADVIAIHRAPEPLDEHVVYPALFAVQVDEAYLQVTI